MFTPSIKTRQVRLFYVNDLRPIATISSSNKNICKNKEILVHTCEGTTIASSYAGNHSENEPKCPLHLLCKKNFFTNL